LAAESFGCCVLEGGFCGNADEPYASKIVRIRMK
jgi:hypothetical protein